MLISKKNCMVSFHLCWWGSRVVYFTMFSTPYSALKLSISNHRDFGELNCKGRIKVLEIASVPTNSSKQRWKCKSQG